MAAHLKTMSLPKYSVILTEKPNYHAMQNALLNVFVTAPEVAKHYKLQSLNEKIWIKCNKAQGNDCN